MNKSTHNPCHSSCPRRSRWGQWSGTVWRGSMGGRGVLDGVIMKKDIRCWGWVNILLILISLRVVAWSIIGDRPASIDSSVAPPLEGDKVSFDGNDSNVPPFVAIYSVGHTRGRYLHSLFEKISSLSLHKCIFVGRLQKWKVNKLSTKYVRYFKAYFHCFRKLKDLSYP